MSTDAHTHERSDSTYVGTQKLLIEVADVVGYKWHTVILHRLLTDGRLAFSDLRSGIDGISNKMLSQSLTTLQERGLVERTVVSDKPVRVEYSLTDRGRALEGVVDEMLAWGGDHLDESGIVVPGATQGSTPGSRVAEVQTDE